MAVNPALAGNLSTAAILGGGMIPQSGIVPPGPIPAPSVAPGAPPISVPGPANSPFVGPGGPPQPAGTPPMSFQDKNMQAAALLQGGAQQAPLPPQYSLQGPQPDGTMLMMEQHPDGTQSIVKIISPPGSKHPSQKPNQ